MPWCAPDAETDDDLTSNKRRNEALPLLGGMQVDGCNADLVGQKEYYQRYRICADHLKLGSLMKDGIPQRCCQQCGRFHLLADFDGNKR